MMNEKDDLPTPLAHLIRAESELEQVLKTMPAGNIRQCCESALKHIKTATQNPPVAAREEYGIGDKVRVVDWELSWDIIYKQWTWLFFKWIGGDILTVADAVHYQDVDETYVTFEEDLLKTWYPAQNFVPTPGGQE